MNKFFKIRLCSIFVFIIRSVNFLNANLEKLTLVVVVFSSGGITFESIKNCTKPDVCT